jgi:gamma-carbonic anhydrase
MNACRQCLLVVCDSRFGCLFAIVPSLREVRNNIYDIQSYPGRTGASTARDRRRAQARGEPRGKLQLAVRALDFFGDLCFTQTLVSWERPHKHQIFSRHRPKMKFRGITPFVTNDTFIAPTATVIGDVTNWDQSTVWYKAVVRADSNHSITIGFASSVGEGSVVLTLPSSVTELEYSGFPPETYIGHYVTVGAGCVLKSCRIEDMVSIGDKCTILEGSLIESRVILEPGSTVLPYQRIPAGQKWSGNPAKFVVDLTYDEKESFEAKALKIHELAREHLIEFLPYGYSYVHLEEVEKKAAAEERR